MAENIFNTELSNTPSIDVSDVNAETLVGEGRKYKTTDDLAKAYVNADTYIASSKAEQAAKDAEIKVLKDLLEARQQKQEIPVEEEKPSSQDALGNEPPVGQHREPNDDKAKDLATQIREQLDSVAEERKFSGNINEVSEKLQDHFGSAQKANEYVNQKAKDLGVSTDWLMDIAGRSTSAFYNTIGFNTSVGQSKSSPNTGSNINTSAFKKTDSGVRNFEYYENIRKTDKKLYFSSDFQKNMMRDAREMGSSFFAR